MNITFTASFTGTPDQQDVIAARQAVFIENLKRAAKVPPDPVLPFGTPAELRVSYLTVLADVLMAVHVENFGNALSDDGITRRFTRQQVEQILSNLVSRLNSGESAAAIVADTAA